MENTHHQHLPPAFPLAMATEGESVRIVSLRQGRKIQEKLLSMGIKVNDKIEVIHRQGKGAILIAKGSNRYAFGGGMALKIEVTREN
ncbi:MAG: hypothetical protein B6I36_00135 [Desulfobacteraceae bacterium 4572_35.1]|nr:MAG: hypothetical protein B6I36_00135 [Desulfobacteraceae bacterium 4572_35.1]